LKALAAVNGFISARLEGNLSSGAAAITDHFIHLTIAIAPAPAIAVALVGSAGRAAAWLVRKAFLGEKSLFGAREHKVDTTVTAG
jgi:hypothetical protein